ncbi:MAG TPA: aldolase/citrate lyase family protein [Lacipirellulaceae bacterium]|jgi:2-keto-3-deoxy-L-rhamnonate aldolase RhmA|nr:aldolase/citrate lyase family protein [Lacipirellulaceae bacterium]
MPSIIKDRLRAGKIVRTMHMVGYSTPRIVEMLGTLGNFHGFWFDQEHSAIPHKELEVLLIACRAAGKDAFARVPPSDYATVMRPMETGCSGVMIAQVRTLEEVKQSVQWVKYPPVGIRGAFTGNAETRYGKIPLATQIETANRDRWLSVQIETPEAVDIVDKIAATEGVDWLFVGPADLSVTLGVPGEFMHPKCLDALKKVGEATKKAGKAWGILTRDIEHARKCRELGCQLFSIMGDGECLRVGMETLEHRFAELDD